MAMSQGARMTRDGERIWFKGGLVTVRVVSGETGSAFNVLEVLEPAPRAELPPPVPQDSACISAVMAQLGIEILGRPPFARVPQPE